MPGKQLRHVCVADESLLRGIFLDTYGDISFQRETDDSRPPTLLKSRKVVVQRWYTYYRGPDARQTAAPCLCCRRVAVAWNIFGHLWGHKFSKRNRRLATTDAIKVEESRCPALVHVLPRSGCPANSCAMFVLPTSRCCVEYFWTLMGT